MRKQVLAYVYVCVYIYYLSRPQMLNSSINNQSTLLVVSHYSDSSFSVDTKRMSRHAWCILTRWYSLLIKLDMQLAIGEDGILMPHSRTRKYFRNQWMNIVSHARNKWLMSPLSSQTGKPGMTIAVFFFLLYHNSPGPRACPRSAGKLGRSLIWHMHGHH